MTKKQWISIAIIIAVIIGLIIAIKYIPVWLTILNLVIFTAGFTAGWLFNKKKELGLIIIPKIINILIPTLLNTIIVLFGTAKHFKVGNRFKGYK